MRLRGRRGRSERGGCYSSGESFLGRGGGKVTCPLPCYTSMLRSAILVNFCFKGTLCL